MKDGYKQLATSCRLKGFKDSRFKIQRIQESKDSRFVDSRFKEFKDSRIQDSWILNSRFKDSRDWVKLVKDKAG